MNEKQKREELIFQLKEIFYNNKEIYIYGAGIVGKRLYDVIHSLNLNEQVTAFAVSEITGNGATQAEIPVVQIDCIKDVDVCILIAVSDAYQNEIEYLLKARGYHNYFNAYMFSFINEKYIPEDIPLDIPDKITINVGELMMEQFEQGDFCRYDALLIEKNKKQQTSVTYMTVDSKMRICDSAEQVACLINSGKQHVEIKRLYDCQTKKCDLEWAENNLSSDRVVALQNMLSKLKNEWNKEYIGLIWPPAFDLRECITQEVANYMQISRTSDICLDKEQFAEFLNRVYEIDDVEEWQIRVKRDRIIKEEKYSIRVLYFYNANPKIHIKRYGHTISQTGMNLKRYIRDKFKDSITDYTHDVILHTTDNYDQSEQLKSILQEYIND